MKHGYLIDMDGVIYRGHELIPGADRFVQQLRTREIAFCFLTNNSQRTRRDVVTKLARRCCGATHWRRTMTGSSWM